MEKNCKQLQEKLLAYLEAKEKGPIAEEQLREKITLNEEEQSLWERAILTLLQRGSLVRTRTGLLGLPSQMNLAVGRFSASSKGFGFVIPDDVVGQDLFLSPADCNGAMNGDRVMVRIHKHPTTPGRAREGEVIRILERAHQQIVGTFEPVGAYGFVKPDDTKLGADVFVPVHEFGEAKPGDKVILALTRYPEKGRAAEGKITHVLGRADDPKVAMEAIIHQYGLKEEFPPEVTTESAGIAQTVPAAAKRNREDLRALPIVTIDGEDARDLDDGVHIETLSNGFFRLGVHIADVSYYVRTDSALDKEAYERGTSVYFPDRVIPMLPPELSNGICSLNAGVDRLAFSCEMDIDRSGTIRSYRIFPSVIRVAKRLSYRQVKLALVENDQAVQAELVDHMDNLKKMAELSQILRDCRMKRGAIDFDFPEIKVKVDSEGKAIGLEKRERSLSESIVEEFMLAANETVARFMTDKKLPFIYRVHEEPDSEKIRNFAELVHNFGYTLNTKQAIVPQVLQAILEQVKEKPEERLLSTVLLRSLRQAAYEAENKGHFGLASQNYTHFTSPIRRYPDLLVHRLLKAALGVKTAAATGKEQKEDYLEMAAKQSSDRERTATQAEREAVDLKKVEYMVPYVGEDFEGFISGVTAFGLFIELANGVEGLVHISTLSDDYYQYLEDQWKLVGRRTGREFRLGDPIKIKLVKASPRERQLDFVLADSELTFIGRKKKFGGPVGVTPKFASAAPKVGATATKEEKKKPFSSRPKSKKKKTDSPAKQAALPPWKRNKKNKSKNSQPKS